MMNELERRFVAALHEAAAAELGEADACTRSLAAAATAGCQPEQVAAAQGALAALPPDRLERVMAVAHRKLALDPAGWLAQWHGPRQ